MAVEPARVNSPETLPATGTTASETLAEIAKAAPETTEATGVVGPDKSLSSEMVTGELPSDANQSTAIGRPVPTARRPDGFVPGQVIAGRYTLLEVFGEGGMGAVYRAEQSQPVKRQVALKLIKTGMDSRTVVARFDAERQALALMDHPNIARVYDGGATEANQPFFVMELVNGPPITEYCDKNRLPVRARLELFVAVCQAVQHAHQKGIIHRDLKPGNVLVTEVDGRPTPKVIDFGVAKAMEFDLTDQSLADTGAIVGTPTYMSPEQADPSSMDIDTRTDVYALGVILYELLAGSPPIDAKQFKRGALLEILRMVREVDPPKPSTKVSTSDALPNIAATRDINPGQLKRVLIGDLDWIVMKALEKDRTRRYETANGFAADILRHLASEPVLAAPPGRTYRMLKFVRKHRTGVFAASLVLLALLAGIAGTTWGLIREAKANAELADKNGELTVAHARVTKANADLSAANAKVEARYNLAVDAIKTFHTGVSEDFLLKEQKFKNLRDRLLKSAADFYGKLGALLGKETDSASRLELAQSNFELAELTDKVGRSEDALAAHRAVLAAREALAAEPESGTAVKVEADRSQTSVSRLLEAIGMSDEALAGYRRAETLLASLAGSDTAARAALADCRTRLGYLLSRTGKSDEALKAYRLAESDLESLAATPGASIETRRNLAYTVHRIGSLLANLGKPMESESAFRRSIALHQKMVDDHAADMEVRNNLAHSHNNLGKLLSETGKPSEAETEYRKATSIYQELSDENPAVTEFRNSLARSFLNMGVLLLGIGKTSQAEAQYSQAMPLYQKLVDENPAVTEYRNSLSQCHRNLGILFTNQGKTTKAEPEYRKSQKLLEKLADENPTNTDYRNNLARIHYSLGLLYTGTGKPREAEAEFRQEIAIRQKLAEANPAMTELRSLLADAYNALGYVLLETGKVTESEEAYRQGTELSQTLADKHPEFLIYRGRVANILSGLSVALRRLGRSTEAREACERAVAINEKLVKDDPKTLTNLIFLAESYLNRGLALRAMGQTGAAEADLRRSVATWDSIPIREGQMFFEIACCHAALSDLARRGASSETPEDGKQDAVQAIDLLRKAVGMGWRSPSAYRVEDALEPLRDREDFKKLLAELEKEPTPKEENKP